MNFKFHFFWVKLVSSFLSFMLKLLAGWLMYLFCKWLNVDEWMMITLIVMSVQSTEVKVSKVKVSNS